MKMFIANWKMQLSLKEEMEYCHDNLESLKKSPHKIILCPSFPSLIGFTQLLHKTDIALGAQNCSAYTQGPYTGQVSAVSLAQAGCSYVLVGHSEERASCNLTDEDVAEKALRVLEAGMIPIVCVGETKEDHDAEKTHEVILHQLEPVLQKIEKAPIYIAYEPLWAIGVGETPQPEKLGALFSWLKTQIQGVAFLYGGSVNEKTIKPLLEIDHISGFLIGGASLRFEEFKKLIF